MVDCQGHREFASGISSDRSRWLRDSLNEAGERACSRPVGAACSLIVRCHNEERHIGRLLSGALGQTVDDVEIIVVDSGSTDATLSIAAQYPARILSIPPDEFSFGRALNLGRDAARSPFLVFASARVYPVFDDWLERLTALFRDPDVAVVYGRQRGDNRSRYSVCQVFAQWFGERSVPDQDHPFCNIANAAIRRSVWERLEYDETLTGLEDIARARAAKARGHRIISEAAAEVLAGATRCLGSSFGPRPGAIWLEVHPRFLEELSSSVAQVEAFLTEHGYAAVFTTTRWDQIHTLYRPRA